MIVPQFIRFYSGYTVGSVMNEYAITFFSLVNAMSRIKATEMLNDLEVYSIPKMEKQNAETAVRELQKKEKGVHGLLEEVRLIRKLKRK